MAFMPVELMAAILVNACDLPDKLLRVSEMALGAALLRLYCTPSLFLQNLCEAAQSRSYTKSDTRTF